MRRPYPTPAGRGVRCTGMQRHTTAFLSYVGDDRAAVARIEAALEARGLPTWLDHTRLRPGEHWRDAVRTAIDGASAFVACFSPSFAAREQTFMLMELELACDELRTRRRERAWLVPVLLGDAELPALPIGGSATLRDL